MKRRCCTGPTPSPGHSKRSCSGGGVPYVIVGGIRFYERREIKDLLAYLRLLVNPADDVSLLRIINVPKRGIGAATVQRLREVAFRRGMGLLQAVTDGMHSRTWRTGGDLPGAFRGHSPGPAPGPGAPRAAGARRAGTGADRVSRRPSRRPLGGSEVAGGEHRPAAGEDRRVPRVRAGGTERFRKARSRGFP